MPGAGASPNEGAGEKLRGWDTRLGGADFRCDQGAAGLHATNDDDLESDADSDALAVGSDGGSIKVRRRSWDTSRRRESDKLRTAIISSFSASICLEMVFMRMVSAFFFATSIISASRSCS